MKVAFPSHVSSVVQGVPPFSSHVSSDIWKSSCVLPFGRTNILSGIWSVFCFPYWLYVMLMLFWKWPGFCGDSFRVRLYTSLAEMFSIVSVSMNAGLVIFMFVIDSFPKLKSWIVSWDSVSAKSSAKSNSGFGFRLRSMSTWNVPFAGG